MRKVDGGWRDDYPSPCGSRSTADADYLSPCGARRAGETRGSPRVGFSWI